mgnify:CR=1 FL=1
MGCFSRNWPVHVFFFCQGMTLFGVGYAGLPLILLLFWLVAASRNRFYIFFDLARDDRTRWVLFYYVIFISSIIVSDIFTRGNFAHLDGPLYNLALGVYMSIGYLLTRSFRSNELQEIAHRWLAFWLLVLLILVEADYREVYHYSHGIFSHPYILFSGVAMMSLANESYAIGRCNTKKLLSLGTAILVVWALSCTYRYCTSDVLPPLFMSGAFMVLFLSTKRYSIYVSSMLFFSGAAFILYDGHASACLRNFDLTSLDMSFIWHKLSSGRDYVWSAAVRIISQHPLFGVGSGRFSAACRSAMLEINPQPPYDTFTHAHSLLLQQFAVHGIFAGVAFIGLLFSLFRLIFHAVESRDSSIFRLMMLGLWFVYFFYGLIDNATLYEEIIPLFWGSAGLLMGAVVGKKGGQE